MNKKLSKIFLFIFVFTLSAYLFYAIKLHRENQANTLNYNEKIVIVKRLIDKGDKLRSSSQDSCKYYYHQAIEKANLLNTSNVTEHLKALGHIGIAALNCNMGNYSESGKEVAIALDIAKNTNDLDIKAQSVNIKGLLFYNQSNYDSASFCYENALELAKAANSKKIEGKIYTNKAIIDYLRENCDLAIENFSKTLEIAKQLNDDDLITGTYINMGLVASNFGQYDKAIDFYDKAIEAYKKINGKDGLILCYQNLGNLYLLLGNYNQVMEVLDLSLQLSEEIGDKSNIAKAHHNKAEVFSRVGDFDQAMEEYLVSIRQKEELNDKSALADGYNGLGNLYFQHSVYNKALEYYQKSLQINEELNLPRGKATVYSYLANVYSAKHQYKEALNYYQKALKLSIEVNNNSGAADHYTSIGAIYSKLKQFDKAEAFLLKALKKKTGLSEKEGIVMVNLELANSELNKAISVDAIGRKPVYEKAVQYGLKAYLLAEELNSIPIINMASNSLKQAYKGLGNDSDALRFAEKFISTNDSLFTKAKAEALTYAEARWSVEKQQDKISSLEAQKKLQDELLAGKLKESKQQKIIIYFGFGLLVMTIAFAVTSAIFNRKRRDLMYQKQLNKLNFLKMQNISNRIGPHFIFNMLSSISHSVEDPELAKNKISNLSMLLRNVIENIEHIAIPFEEELSIVQRFVELQKDKLPTPFEFKINIDPGLNLDVLIPAMIVQIPVENALKHGLMRKENGKCELLISAKKMGNGCKILVVDNGIGLNNRIGRTSGTGTGLKMVMQTIQFLNSRNKNKIAFSVKERNDLKSDSSGTMAEIFIPTEYSFQMQPER